MTRLLPRTLVGQMIIILLAGLIVSHLVASWIYATDREQAVRAIGGYAATQRIANLARLIDEAPEDWRGRIVAAASDPTLRVSLVVTATRGPPRLPIPPTCRFEAISPSSCPKPWRRACASPSLAAAGAPLAGFTHPMPMMGPWMHGARAGAAFRPPSNSRTGNGCPSSRRCRMPGHRPHGSS